MSAVGIERIIQLRQDLNQDGYQLRKLILSVDGSYTNETVLRKLPENVVLLGRIRKDAKLYALPTQEKKPGSADVKPIMGMSYQRQNKPGKMTLYLISLSRFGSLER